MLLQKALYKKPVLIQSTDMRKKHVCILALSALIISCVLCTDVNTYLPSLHQGAILPSIDGFGTVASNLRTEPILTLKQALETPYSLNWTELYFDESKKKALTQVYGDLLSSTLPVQLAYFSNPKLQNNVYSIAVYLPKTGTVLEFLMDMNTNRIISIDKNN